MAGESAREAARRQREKAARLQQSAELWERGAEGERRTAEALSALPSETWTVFHDLRWPGRRYANVDHVVVGPPGVFVIDSKNWSGTVAIRDGVLRCNGYAKEKQVSDAAEAALAVSRLTPLLRPDLVKPVLCFVREEPLSGWSRDVMITSTSTVVSMLQSRPPVLSSDDVRHLCLDLNAGIRSALTASPPPPTPTTSRTRSTGSSPRVSQPRRSASRRHSAGELIALLLVLTALVAFLGSSGVRDGIGDWLVGVMTSNVADTSEHGEPRPVKARCQRADPPPGCGAGSSR